MRKYFLILLATTLFFGACKKEDSLKELSLIIEGVVFDKETSTPLEGAIVKLSTQDETYTDTTDANGMFSLGEFITGTYVVFVGKAGYTTEIINASSSTTAVNEKTEQSVFSTEVELTPLNQSISCTVYKSYQEAYMVKKVAANVNYEISYEGLNGKITGKTNGNGLLVVDSLPYKTYVEIAFNFTVSGVIYKDYSSYYTGESLSSIDIYGYDANGKLAVTASNILDGSGNGVENFAIDGEIYMSFNQPIDTNNVDFFIEDKSYDVVWSQNNMRATLIMDPALSSNTTYHFLFWVLNSSSSQALGNDFNFKTAPLVVEPLKNQQ